MKRLVIGIVLGYTLLFATATASAGTAEAPRAKKPAPTPVEAAEVSKADLRDSYKPAIVNGMPWFRSAKSVLLHNERRGAKGRPILFLRILGDFDSGT